MENTISRYSGVLCGPHTHRSWMIGRRKFNGSEACTGRRDWCQDLRDETGGNESSPFTSSVYVIERKDEAEWKGVLKPLK